MVVLASFLFASCFGGLVFLMSLSWLTKANMEAYSEWVEMTCLLLTFRGEKFKQEYRQSKENLSIEEHVRRCLVSDAQCQSMIEKMSDMREFLIEVKNSIRATVLPAVNFVYAVIVAACIVAVFWLYVIFLESRTLDVDKCGGTMTTAVTVTAGVIVAVGIVSQPLFAMAAEAHTWEQKVVKALNAPRKQAVSAMISPAHDRKMLFEDHAALQDAMTWKILGQPMLPSSIVGALSAYFLIIWTTVVWPAIQDYVDQLQAQLA